MSANVYFENIQHEIFKLLRSSQESVKICVAWVNGQIYAPIFQEISSRGVNVEVIYNNDHTNQIHGIPSSSQYYIYPIDTRLSSALMHNKFCIIDNEVVISGSYNWSQKAGKSFENLVVIRNELKMVKSFLHEFYDLKAYYNAFSNSKLKTCHCKSHSYNLAILGQESGKYNESKIDIWSICVKNQHVYHYGEEYDQYLQTYLGMVDSPDWENDGYDKNSMLGEFNMERDQIESLQSYFKGRPSGEINAVGVINIHNRNEHIKYNEEPLYCINMIWRDMYYRKIIPDILFDDGIDGINKIIIEQV